MFTLLPCQDSHVESQPHYYVYKHESTKVSQSDSPPESNH